MQRSELFHNKCLKKRKNTFKKSKKIFFLFLKHFHDSLPYICPVRIWIGFNFKYGSAMRFLCFCLSVALFAACEAFEALTGTGELRISFVESFSDQTRALSEIPDTGDFIITIDDSKGKQIYKGPYSACPEIMEVSAGSYVVKVVSREFSAPEFSAPQYGDEQCVVVPPAGVADVKLLCTQLNAGIKLKIASDFLTACPNGVLFLKSSAGKLMYGYSEKRTAYFSPGSVSLILSENGADKVLMTRTLVSQDMLSLGVRVAASSSTSSVPSASLSIEVDTTRNWLSENIVIGQGGSGGGETSSKAMTVSQAINSAGEEDVWVCGYIVGGDLTSASASFQAPFSSRTNILIGPKSSTNIKSSCLSVQLPAGEIRDMLNLVDNPSLLGRKVYLRGNIVDAYYGIPGIKNISECEF